MTKVNVPSRKAVRELICYQRAGEESVSDCPMRAEKFSKQQSQQAALQLPSCSHDFLRMLRCLCSPRSDQTGCVHCVLPASGKVWSIPIAPQQLFWHLLPSLWHKVRLQRADAFPSLWAWGAALMRRCNYRKKTF